MKSARPIFLVGFMGAGKTTVGRTLARLLGRRFFDLDDLIAEAAGRSIKQIFSDSGEGEFRRMECEAIERCRSFGGCVVALGGGAYASDKNRAALAEIGITIWLECPLEVCLERVGLDESRPMLGREADMESLLARRVPAYASADYAVDSSAGSPEAIAARIVEVIGFTR